jgi:hypothetical protein
VTGPSPRSKWNNIGSLLTQLSVNPSEVDLVLDYKYVKPDERVRTILFICGTSFPTDLSIDSN